MGKLFVFLKKFWLKS